jgi:hypothetical protein
MVHFKSNGFEFSLPSCYGDLTLSQFFKLKELQSNKLIDILPILSGLDKYTWEQFADIDIDEKIAPCLEFLNGEFDCHLYFVPDYINISGKQYPKPKSVGLNTFGQKLALQSATAEAEKEGKNSVDVYPYALALYMQPIVTGKPYDSDEVDKLLPDIMECKLSEAWPLCSFFLLSFEQSLSEKAKSFHTLQQRKRLEQELKNLKSSATFQQFSLWRKLSIKLLTMFYSRIMPRYTQPFLMRQKQIVIRDDTTK